jgi:hypothetical protein
VVVEVKAWVCRLWVGAWAVGGPACVTDSIEHGSDSSATMTTGATDSTFGPTSPSTTESFFGDTNFPEPALTQCGGLENMALPMDGLISAWGVIAVAGAVDGQGPVPEGSVRIRLGQQPLFDCRESFRVGACGEDSTGTGGTSGSSGGSGSGSGGMSDGCGWGLAFTLSPTEAMPGLLELALLEKPKFEVATEQGTLDIDEDVEGFLDLFRVTPDCIVGKIDGAAFNGGIDHPDFQGGFVAQLCQSTCVPLGGHHCL